MMAFFRRMVRSRIGAFVAVLFVALLGFAFAAGDISNYTSGSSFFGPGTNEAVTAGDEKLSTAELQDRVQRVHDNNRKNNPGLTMVAFMDAGGYESVLGQLADSLAVTAFGKDQGMIISKKLVDAEIARIPAFQTAAGQFSQSQYDDMLKSQRVTDKALREDLARQILERQLLAPASGGAVTPDGMVDRYASMLLEARSGTAAPIPSVAFIGREPPAAAALAAFYRANGARFALPEQRRVRYAVIDAAGLGNRAKPTEAEIAHYYRANAARYAASDTRSVRQLVVASESAARAIAAKIGNGTSLDAAAAAAGLAPTNIGPLARDAFAKQASDAAAAQIFSASRDALVGPVKTALGWTLYRVTEIRPVAARSLDAARAEITEALTKTKTQQALADVTNAIDGQIGDGSTFDEVVKTHGLTVATTPAITKEGRQLIATPQPATPDLVPLATAGFGMEPGDDPQVIALVPDQRYAVVTVGQVIAAGPPPLDQIRPAVERFYMLRQGAAKAKAMADTLRGKIAGGMSAADAIAKAGVPLPAPQTLAARRADVGSDGESVPPALVALFSMKQGTVRVLPLGGDQGYVVLRLDRIIPGDARNNAQLRDATKQGLANVLSAEYAQQFTRAVARAAGVKRNEAAIRKVEADLRGSGTAAP